MPDQYTRTRAQLGTPALDALRKAHVGAGASVLVGHEWFLPYILYRPVGAGHFRPAASRQTFCIGMAEGRAYPAPTVHLFFRLARRSNTVS